MQNQFLFRCRHVITFADRMPLLILQYPEYIIQAALTVLYLLSGNWFAGCVQLIALAYNVQQVRGYDKTLVANIKHAKIGAALPCYEYFSKNAFEYLFIYPFKFITTINICIF